MGDFNGPAKIPARMERVVKFFDGKWFASERASQIDMTSSCLAQEDAENRICILGLILKYYPDTGFLRLDKEDFEANKRIYDTLKVADVGRLMAHVEWPQSHIVSRLNDVVGYLPCNVKWSNALRFDPSDREGKCLHFTAVSEGTIFVVFSAVPNDKDTWYYVQISPYRVGIFKVCHYLL